MPPPDIRHPTTYQRCAVIGRRSSLRGASLHRIRTDMQRHRCHAPNEPASCGGSRRPRTRTWSWPPRPHASAKAGSAAGRSRRPDPRAGKRTAATWSSAGCRAGPGPGPGPGPTIHYDEGTCSGPGPAPAAPDVPPPADRLPELASGASTKAVSCRHNDAVAPASGARRTPCSRITS